MSENLYGTVQDLFIATKECGRKNVDFIEIDLEWILEDKFHGRGSQRSILIASLYSYMLASEQGIDIKHGLLGENILLDVNPYSLKQGDRIEIGNAVLEITQNCTICNSLAKVDENLPDILKTDRGIFAKTHKAGRIYKNDTLKVVIV